MMVNFLIYYELDQDTVKTPLRLADYGGSDEDAWVFIRLHRAVSAGGGECGG